MLTRIINRAAGLSALMVILQLVVCAQTGQVEGTVKVKAEDGSLKPVAGALVDIYRTDIKGHWDAKTDKTGRYVRLGLALGGSYTFIVSGPGIDPAWSTDVRISQLPKGALDFTVNPGDGRTVTLDQVMAAVKSGGGRPAPSAADRAKSEAAKKEYDTKLKESQALQANFDTARTHYNTGVELMKANNFEGALPEFEQAAAVDPSKHAAMALLSYRANASLAESHYQVGVDLFNKKNRDGAKPHFEQALAAAKKAIEISSTDTPENNPNLNNDRIIYYNIFAKNAQLLVEYFGAANIVDDTIKAYDKAAELDAANKNRWGVSKADLYRAATRTDEAIAAYKAVIAADPNNIDALYGLGLTLIAGTEKAQIQEGANALADFVAKAPATDKRVPIVKDSLEAVKNAYKVEAEKPARRGGRKP